MGENPALWADATITPCPCSKAFYEEVMAYSRILQAENERGVPFPYSHRQMVAWTTEKPPKKAKVKERIIPLTQQRF